MVNNNNVQEDPATTVAKKGTLCETAALQSKSEQMSVGLQIQLSIKHPQDGYTKGKLHQRPPATPSKSCMRESSHFLQKTKEDSSKATDLLPRKLSKRIFKRPYLCSLDKEQDR